MGLASFIRIKCTNCCFENSTYASKRVDNKENTFEVNTRSIYARRCGGGHKNLEMTRTNYESLSEKLHTATEKVAINSMIQAAVELKEVEGCDVGVSFDGSWQRRGYSSCNGVGTAISITTGKILDCEILS